MMQAESGVFPPEIKNSLRWLAQEDAGAFRRKLKQQANDPRQRDHTAIELMVGVFGKTLGYYPQYEPALGGQTPDWLFLDSNNKPCFFAEVVSFHMATKIEGQMHKACQEGDVWCDYLPGSEGRLLQPLRDKVAKYKMLADKMNLPFIIVVYGFFDAFLHPKEVSACLRDPEFGLFHDFPQLTGVYLAESGMPLGIGPQREGYRFRFFANENASRPLILRDDILPRPIAPPPA
jgi:hypothetical protein